MPNSNELMKPWGAPSGLSIASSNPASILKHANRSNLSDRDIRAIVSAFRGQNFEMAATFVWAKAASILKRQIASLGMDFVGEMLRRPDLTADSDPTSSLSDREALGLAEDLGMINSTQALRLSHAVDIVGHFTKLNSDEAVDEGMNVDEATALLRACVVTILGQPQFEGASRFRDFRNQLGSESLTPEKFELLLDTPYFFIRTTLSILLSLVKASDGAQQEHAIGNISSAIPVIWPKLRQPEKWQVGQAFAEVNSEGDKLAVVGLRTALLKVKGFDFVPESLRSRTFTEAAGRVLTAHFGWNNFYKEGQPMAVLASLGSTIPRPAFPKCMEAILAVRLGNAYGVAHDAAAVSDTMLTELRSEQWDYYLNECLSSDKTILDKLAFDSGPIKRWIAVAKDHQFASRQVRDRRARSLIEATNADSEDEIKRQAMQMRKSMRK